MVCSGLNLTAVPCGLTAATTALFLDNNAITLLAIGPFAAATGLTNLFVGRIRAKH